MELQRKRYYLLLGYLALLLPFVAFGAFHAMETNANSPLDWVPADFPARQEYDSFTNEFGSGDILILSWEGCTLDEPLIDQFAHSLRTDPVFYDENSQWLFERVQTGREMYAGLTSPPISLTPEAVLDRFRGSWIGPDDRQTSVIVTFNQSGLKRRGELVQWIEAALAKYVHLKPENWHMAGPVMDGLSVDKAGKAALDQFALPSILLIFYLCFFCLRSWRAASLIFALSLLASGMTLALVYFRGEEMSALSIVMPPLVQVLTVSGGIHLVNYYYEALRDPTELQPAKHAFQMGWLPCLLSAGTTAIGLLSLTLSDLTPIQNFGLDAALGVLITTFLLLAVVPGYFHFWPLKQPVASDQFGSLDMLEVNVWNRIWRYLTQFLNHTHYLITSVALICLVLSAVGIQFIQTSVRIETLFQGENRVLQDYAWIEEHLGPVVSVEVLVDCDHSNSLTSLERYRLISRLQEKLQQNAEIHTTLSSVDFLAPLPANTNMPPTEYTERLELILKQSQSAVSNSGYLLHSHEKETFRITACASALAEIDYGDLLERLQTEIKAELKSLGYSEATGITTRFTGIMPLVHNIQRQLMRDLHESFLSVFLIITVIMTLVQGGISTALISMIPNIFPVLLIFGITGWCDYPIDIGSVMTASVALGVAVDDTLHYLSFFQRGLARGFSRPKSVHYAFQHCGKAMMQTTLICGVGMLIFSLSDFVPTCRFAWMMLFLLSAALVGDLIVLPAILLGPIGRLFEHKPRHAQQKRPSLSTPPRPPVRDRIPEPRREAEPEPAEAFPE